MFRTANNRNNMQTYGPRISKQTETRFLAPPPRSGHLSVYAKKLSSQAFVWLCSAVVWGNVSNFIAVYDHDYDLAHAIVQIVCSLAIWLLITLILIFNWFAESSSWLRNRLFSHSLEAQLTGVLILLWVPAIISVSDMCAAPPVAIWFTWLGFFGSVYATVKAYHTFKEEDLPSDPPDAFDDDDYVYG